MKLFKQEKIFFIHTKGKRIFSKIFSMIYHQEFKNVDSRIIGFSMKYLDQMLKVDENCYEVQVLIDCVQKEIKVKEIVVDQNKECFHLKIIIVISFTLSSYIYSVLFHLQ